MDLRFGSAQGLDRRMPACADLWSITRILVGSLLRALYGTKGFFHQAPIFYRSLTKKPLVPTGHCIRHKDLTGLRKVPT